MDRIAEIWSLWEKTAKEGNPNSVYVGNLGGGIDTVKDVKRLSQVAAWFNADNQGRRGNMPIWECAQQGRVARSVMDGRTVTNVVGSYSNSSINWRHAAKAPAETTMWAAQAAASGMVPWYHWLSGQPQDNRWRENDPVFFDWLAANQTHFRNRRPLANLAVLYPQSTIAFYGSNGTRTRKLNGATIDQTAYLQGLYAVLLEGRFLFDFVHQENLDAATLKPYRALLLPNAAYLRDSECEAIRDYVKSGGSVLATFETARYNEWGVQREDFGLSDLFGVSVAGEVIGPFGNSYMRIDQPHPILEGFTGTTTLPGPEFQVPITHLKSEGPQSKRNTPLSGFPSGDGLPSHPADRRTRCRIPRARIFAHRVFCRGYRKVVLDLGKSRPQPTSHQFGALDPEPASADRYGRGQRHG